MLALVDTIARFGIAPELFSAFLDSMRMDTPGSVLFRNRYETIEQLREYMYGSAEVIGLQMLPILGTVQGVAVDDPAVTEMARALGEAFQLTNFIRDIGEDLDRDRIYLPTNEFEAFGVDEVMLRECRAGGRSTREVQEALAHLVAVTRVAYRHAEPGISLLDKRSRTGIRVAFELYRDILNEIEALDYHILRRRAHVGRAGRAKRALQALLHRG